MASTINATSTGSGGLITTGNSVNQLEIQTGDTTRMVIDSSGNVTIQGQGDLRLADSDSSHYIALQAAGSMASNVTFTLPSVDGTSGQVLQTNGSGTLSFATPAGGSWTYLSTVTANNSGTLDIETTIDSTYDTYAIVMSGLVTTGNGASTRVQFKISGTYESSNYRFFVTDFNSSAGGSGGFNSSVSNAGGSITINTGTSTSAGSSMSGIIYLANPSSTALHKQIYGQTSSLNTNQYQSTFTGSYTGSTTAVTGVRIFFSSGNISTGSVRLYGIKNS